MHLELISIIVPDYDTAIDFFVNTLDFELVEDSPSLTNDGRPKRWVVVRPANQKTGLLLAQADGELQTDLVGRQFAGRVGLFLRVENFAETYHKLVQRGVEFTTQPREESYGSVAVFKDIFGNKWDLLG